MDGIRRYVKIKSISYKNIWILSLPKTAPFKSKSNLAKQDSELDSGTAQIILKLLRFFLATPDDVYSINSSHKSN